MKQLFDESHGLISFADIDSLGKNCASAEASDLVPKVSHLDHSEIVKVFKNRAYPLLRDQARFFPPLPETPGRTIAKDFIARITGELNQAQMEPFFDYLQTTVSETEIDSEFTDGPYAYEYRGPYSARARKNGKLIAFNIRGWIGSKSETSSYGYCWPQK